MTGCGNNASEKMALAVVSDNLNQVIVELLAILYSPIIVALIDRDDKSFVRSLHIGNELRFRAFHSLSHLF